MSKENTADKKFLNPDDPWFENHVRWIETLAVQTHHTCEDILRYCDALLNNNEARLNVERAVATTYLDQNKPWEFGKPTEEEGIDKWALGLMAWDMKISATVMAEKILGCCMDCDGCEGCDGYDESDE